MASYKFYINVISTTYTRHFNVLLTGYTYTFPYSLSTICGKLWGNTEKIKAA